MSFESLVAEEFRNDFEAETKCLTPKFDRLRIALKTHEHSRAIAFAGQGAERLQFITNEFDLPVSLETPIAAARIIDELTLSVAVSCNRPGVQLSARVVFPHQIDPATGQPLTRLIHGDVLEETNSWQTLTCRTDEETVARHLVLWRGSLKPVELDARNMYIDRLILSQTLGRGMTEILVDDVRLGPVISPADVHLSQPDGQAQSQRPNVEFQLDQLQVDGRPFFPIMLPYQREPIELFERIGANVVWVDNYLNRDLIGRLNERGLWATAWPPRAKAADGRVFAAAQADPAPLGPETDGILFWNLGVRLEPETHPELKEWVRQIKSSDRVQRRPILADVSGAETVFSRDVEMLGISKHILQSPYGFRDFSTHLQQRKNRAQPGTFAVSWIQTEPSRAVTEYRRHSQMSPAVIEPEQIRLQTYAALSAGCRGVGFWNWTPLNAEGPGSEERRLVLEQLILELQLLEPFLAGGDVIQRFEVPLKSAMSEAGLRVPQRAPIETAGVDGAAGLSAEARFSGDSKRAELAAMVTVLRSEYGHMILLNGLEKDAQYVPGPQAQNDMQIMIRGMPESAFLWELTTTGLRPLETNRVTGGTEIRLPRFNMTAMLMVASDQAIATIIERKILQTQKRAAELAVRLAEAKFARVMTVDQELIALGVGLDQATALLDRSRRILDTAREAYVKQQYHQSRDGADRAAQLLRVLQRLHWQEAIEHLSAPTSMPHTICFQTLPDYWRLIQKLGTGETLEVASVRSGRFEDPDAMRVEGWTKDVSESNQIVVHDALHPHGAREGDYCLRMLSVPATTDLASSGQPMNLQNPAVSYRSPPIPVKPGDLLYVTGWVKIPRPITESISGFRVYDSQYGLATCLKWSEPTDWQQFELIRPIWKQEQLHLYLELNGLGDVSIDDLQARIIRLSPGAQPTVPDTTGVENKDPKSRGNALKFLNRFIK